MYMLLNQQIMISISLSENGVSYGTFNYAWGYIEDNYNNR